jgi:hypothetical protein
MDMTFEYIVSFFLGLYVTAFSFVQKIVIGISLYVQRNMSILNDEQNMDHGIPKMNKDPKKMNWALLTSFFVYSWISLSQNQFTWNFDYVRIVSDFVHFDLISEKTTNLSQITDKLYQSTPHMSRIWINNVSGDRHWLHR